MNACSKLHKAIQPLFPRRYGKSLCIWLTWIVRSYLLGKVLYQEAYDKSERFHFELKHKADKREDAHINEFDINKVDMEWIRRYDAHDKASELPKLLPGRYIRCHGVFGISVIRITKILEDTAEKYWNIWWYRRQDYKMVFALARKTATVPLPVVHTWNFLQGHALNTRRLGFPRRRRD